MTAKQSDVAEHLEALFKNLDAAQLAPKTILKSKAHKEHYETYVMFAFGTAPRRPAAAPDRDRRSGMLFDHLVGRAAIKRRTQMPTAEQAGGFAVSSSSGH